MTLLTAIPSELPGRNQDEETFVRLMDQLFAALPGLQSQMNTIIAEINALVVNANDSKTAAEGFLAAIIVYATNAANSASAAALSTNVTKWVTGITYVASDIGRVVWSPTDFQNYRLMIAGTSTIDPALEDGIGSPRMWRKINYEQPWRVVSGSVNAISGDKLMFDTRTAQGELILPASPIAGVSRIDIVDYGNTFGTNKLIINGNGNKIEFLAENSAASKMGFNFGLVYVDATVGWKRV